MEKLIEQGCHVAKRMQTTRTKSGDDELVTCSINVKGLRCGREDAELVAGVPPGTLAPFFDEAGTPFAHVSMLFPKRELLATGKVEHRRESGAAMATLKVTNAGVSNIRANLDVPVDQKPTLTLSFTLTWKAAGDEVEEVESLLARQCFAQLTFRDPPKTEKLFSDSKASPKAEAKAAAAQKVERKRLAAGEKAEDQVPAKPPAPAPVDVRKAAKESAPDKTPAVGKKFEQEARDRAARHPRREPPKGKRKH